MKSDVCKLSQDRESLSVLLNETEKAAAYSELDRKQAGRLRLLAEELTGMLPELLSFSDGEFWIESSGKDFELHTALTPDKSMTSSRREKLMQISSSGKNIAAAGIMSKIKLAAEFMLADYEENAVVADSFYSEGLSEAGYFPLRAWSLNTYRLSVSEEKNENWDELERSIIANIADEVLVGIRSKQVEIIVKKSFKDKE